jgi:hypothetical protein
MYGVLAVEIRLTIVQAQLSDHVKELGEAQRGSSLPPTSLQVEVSVCRSVALSRLPTVCAIPQNDRTVSPTALLLYYR